MATKEIKCRCKTKTDVEIGEATGYVKVTPFMCDCGRTYLIRDYVNGITSAGEVEAAEYDEMVKIIKAEQQKEKEMNDRDKYIAVEKWLNNLSEEDVADIEAQRTFKRVIDKEFVIETILEHCRYEDDLLDKLYKKSQQVEYEKGLDFYMLTMYGCVDPHVTGPYDTEDEVQSAIADKVEAPDNHQNAYTYFSVTKGAEVKF